MVANEWKDANDKVMPVKQWLEERRFLQVFLHPCLPVIMFCMLYCYSESSSIATSQIFEKFLIISFFVFKGEMQQLRDKLAITERAAKSEAQLKVNCLFLSLLKSEF